MMAVGFSVGFIMSKNMVRSEAQPVPPPTQPPLKSVPPIQFTITPVPGSKPELRIRLELTGLVPNSLVQLQMPTWCPGDYRLQNFAQYVHDVQFSAVKAARHIDSNTWEVETGTATSLTCTYRVAPSPAGFFTENVCINHDWAFISGTAAFLTVSGHRNDPITLHIHPPDGWDIATPLDPGKEANTFTAPDYDTFVDSPLLLGQMRRHAFTVDGVPHEVIAFRHAELLDAQVFTERLKPLLAAEIHLFGKVPPYKRYLFFVDVGGGGGGLEHANSCRLGYRAGMNISSLVKLSAHEIFHLWNIKRIRPESLTPIDYITPPKTNNLWFAEGVTEYYAQRSLLKAGLISPQSYLQDVAREIARFRNTDGSRFTADESSQYVWEANNSRGWGGMSFYNRGYLIGLCLDLKIRATTQGEKSLDDVMRLLNSPGKYESGVSENGIRDAVNQVVGQNFTPFYHRLCRTTEAPPFLECLSSAGFTLESSGSITLLPHPSLEQRMLRCDWLSLP